MLQMRVLLCVVCASLLWQSCGADDAPTPAAQPLRMTPGMLAAVLQVCTVSRQSCASHARWQGGGTCV